MSIMNRAKKGKAKANTRSILRRFMLFRTSDIGSRILNIQKTYNNNGKCYEEHTYSFFLFEGSLKPFSL